MEDGSRDGRPMDTVPTAGRFGKLSKDATNEQAIASADF